MSLSIRIFIWLWVALLAVAGLMLAWPLLVPVGPQQLDARLTEYSERQVGKVDRMLSRGKKGKWLKHRQVLPDGGMLWLYDADQSRFITDKIPPEFIQQAQPLLDLEQPLLNKMGPHWVVGPLAVRHADHQYLLFLGLPERISRGVWLRNMLRQSPLLLMCVALLLGGLAFVVARQIVKPLAQLRGTANLIAAGDFKAPVDQAVQQRKDEIGSLARSVSSMATTIDDALAAHKRLLSDVSHELRSPLTRLSLANSLLVKRLGSNTESDRISHESDVLNDMIGQLLSLSRMQLMPEHDKQRIDFMAVLKQCVDNLRFTRPDLHIELNVMPTTLATIDFYGNADLLQRAIGNVLDNAGRYAESSLNVELTLSDQQLTLSVDDDGCGVPQEEHDKLFEPFYRPEFARQRERGGAGLGLAIVAQAVRFHHGEVRAETAESGGLRVVMSLPTSGEVESMQ
ncbi:HAMP domain-containing protein [Neiella sp. HB171785]|uniref:histidine kinase n=1 Tax=Neiella litorisoli TaxID=2771431 RepID=A0A8J6UEY9_9GAMM|nr:ATP-binding protein [Neiella litorisoli]MBD1390209.1 HAMP domain-containing protein [Neiella litorisoli]